VGRFLRPFSIVRSRRSDFGLNSILVGKSDRNSECRRPSDAGCRTAAEEGAANEGTGYDGAMSRGWNPHISPSFMARAARCRAQWGFRPRGPAGAPSAVRRWGSRAEIKARGGSRCPSIVDDELRRDRPRPPSARRVAAAWPRLRRCRSSAMEDIAVVGAPRIRGHGARNGRRWGLRPGLAGRGVVLGSTSSTLRRENAAGCGASAAAAGTR